MNMLRYIMYIYMYIYRGLLKWLTGYDGPASPAMAVSEWKAQESNIFSQ